jgi:hypothetical protein
MENTLLKKIGIVVLLAALSGVASAKDTCKLEQFWLFSWEVCTPVVEHGSPPASAPEIDPGSAMAALTMLTGGLAIVRGRRSKNPVA